MTRVTWREGLLSRDREQGQAEGYIEELVKGTEHLQLGLCADLGD